MSGGERVRTQGSTGSFLRCLEALEEAKLFGMHVGSVLSGLDAGNVNTDSKISIVGLGTCACRGVKNDDFRWLETLEGTFGRKYMSQSCMG